MHEIIILMAILLWLLGTVTGQTFGGVIHIFLALAIVAYIVRLFKREQAV